MTEILRQGRQPLRELLSSVETAFSQHTGITKRRVVKNKNSEEYFMEWIGADRKVRQRPVAIEDLGGSSLKVNKWRVFMYVPQQYLL